MLLPEGVRIDAKSGVVTPMTGHYVKRLSELAGVFQDKRALVADVKANNDPIVYEVAEYKKDGSDVFFGTTTMYPGNVAGEYFMTRGHFHERRDMGEVYYTQSGEGVLLLESRDGQSEVVEMRPGVCAFIPPDWAHRSINVGSDKLVFVWVCNPLAGHDYGDILKKGMRKLVMKGNGRPKIADNPAYQEA
jgi:glucose-6-phosphate isomerase